VKPKREATPRMVRRAVPDNSGAQGYGQVTVLGMRIIPWVESALIAPPASKRRSSSEHRRQDRVAGPVISSRCRCDARRSGSITKERAAALAEGRFTPRSGFRSPVESMYPTRFRLIQQVPCSPIHLAHDRRAKLRRSVNVHLAPSGRGSRAPPSASRDGHVSVITFCTRPRHSPDISAR
jgi:hypothetical protein